MDLLFAAGRKVLGLNHLGGKVRIFAKEIFLSWQPSKPNFYFYFGKIDPLNDFIFLFCTTPPPQMINGRPRSSRPPHMHQYHSVL